MSMAKETEKGRSGGELCCRLFHHPPMQRRQFIVNPFGVLAAVALADPPKVQSLGDALRWLDRLDKAASVTSSTACKMQAVFRAPGPEHRAASRRQAATLASAGHAVRRRRSGVATLSEREVEVLQYLARGAMLKMVARELALSVKTVDRHAQNIYSKILARTCGAGGDAGD